MYNTIVYPPTFYDTAALSASHLKILRNNAAALDVMARRGFMPFVSNRRLDWETSINPHRIWWGAFQYRAGLTTATLKVYAVPSGQGEALRVLFNGVTVYNATMTSGINTVTVALSSLTLNDKEIVRVDVDSVFPSNPNGSAAQYMLTEAYLTPGTSMNATAWVAPATFGSLSAANLNTLVNAQRHLIDRLAVLPMPLQMSLRHVGGWWEPYTLSLGIWRWARTSDKTRLRVIVDYASRHNASTTIQIRLNASTVDSFSFGSFASGTYTGNIDITGYTADTSTRLEIFEVVNTGPPTWRGAVNTKYTTRLIETVNPSYTGISLPTETDMRESMTFSTLQGRLNSLGTALTNIYNTANSNAFTLNQVPMFARRPILVDDHDAYHQNWYIARKKREGNVLVVRGKNLRIGWGAIQVENIDENKYKFTYEETLVGGETTETKAFYLDQFDGLFHGFPYFVLGEYLEYAAEYYSY